MANIIYTNRAGVNPSLDEVLDLNGNTSPTTSLPTSYDLVNSEGQWAGYVFRFVGTDFSYNGAGKPTGGTITGAQIFAPGASTLIASTTASSGSTLDMFLNFSNKLDVLDSWFAGQDTNTGGSGNDHLKQYGEGASANSGDSLYGGGGNDVLTRGTNAVDGLFVGGSGNDIISLGAGFSVGFQIHGHDGIGTGTLGEIDRVRIVDASNASELIFSAITDIDELEFTDLSGANGIGIVRLSLDQIGPGRVSNTLAVIGSSGDDQNVIRIVAGTGTSADLSGWTFSKWGRSGQSVSFDLHTAVTKLTIVGTALDDSIVGGKGADTLSGNLGNDELNGGPGGDLMSGGAGDDTYFVNDSADVVSDTGGVDLVISELSYKMPLNIEKLGLTGDKNLTATGNELDNRISDGGGNDVLRGMAGDDMLRSGQGVNKLFGGAGKDTFVFTLFPQKGNVAKIMDFDPKSETILLGDGSFSGLKIGTLKKSQFASGDGLNKPKDGSDRIIYDTKSGNLYFFDKNQDSDPVRKFANLKGSPDQISHKDFLIDDFIF